MSTLNPPRWVVVLLATLFALGCAGDLGADGDDNPDGGAASDGGIICRVALTWDPPSPIASPNVQLRVDARVESQGALFAYDWTVAREGVPIATELAQPDGSAVQFPIVEAGVYTVLAVVQTSLPCESGSAQINVEAPGANVEEMRLRVRPPVSVNLPPEDKFVQVKGGQAEYSLGSVVLDEGRAATGQVRNGSAPISAYLRFIPIAARDAFVEHFAGDDGAYDVRVVSEPHDVLIIPSVDGYAPQLVKSWMPSLGATLTLDAGTPVTGVVRDSANAAIAGAKVQLIIDGVPSTLGTTDAAGAFGVLARPVAGAPVVVDVAPPAARGLPRLVASSTALALGASLQIRYAIGTRDVGTAIVRRGGSALPGARVAIVGATPAIGTVATGGAPVSANGTTRLVLVADGAGRLPSAPAPAAALATVTQVAAGDLAVAAFDLRDSVPALVDAPPRVAFATAVSTAAQDPIAGAVVDAIPLGALALAGAPELRFAAGGAGQVTGLLPAGGHYELRVHDPRGAGSLTRVADVTPATIAPRYSLGVPLKILGGVRSSASFQPIPGSSVQLLCTACTGLDRNRPIGEGVTNGNGDFSFVVPDPGTAMN